MAEGEVRLKPGPHRVLEGSPWVYRTEIEPTTARPGAVVRLLSARGRLLGEGFYNPQSMIAVRIMTFSDAESVTPALVSRRIREAWALREELAGDRDAYRLVHAEADGLPGLVVDRYGPVFVVEVTSLGMNAFLPTIVETLVEHGRPLAIYERGDLPVRDREGLPRVNRILYGSVPATVEIHEHGVIMQVNLLAGQKTGHFLDQYANRGRVGELAAGRRVFDAFCHTGGFGLVAARHGAEDVTAIDIDPEAILQAEQNARINRLDDRMRFVTANAFDWLRQVSDQGPQFDLGILDPPAFTKSKDRVPEALRGYKEINLRGMKLIRPGGFLVTSSCSYHVSETEFIRVVQQAGHDAKRRVRILEIRGQGVDHPVLPALWESRYLKCLVLRID